MFEKEITAEVKKQIDNMDISSIVNRAVIRTLDLTVSKMVSKTMESLIPEINKMISESISTHLDNNARMAVKASLGHQDVKSLLRNAVSDHLDLKVERFEFPDSSIPSKSVDWTDTKFSGDMIEGGLIKKFNSTGIQDNATDCQLTIVDGVVVAERHLISRSLRSEKASFKDLEVEGDLEIKGNLKTSEAVNKVIANLVKHAVENRLNSGISLDQGKITHAGALLIDTESLGPSVISSNLRKLGLLQDLRVSGPTKLSETMMVSDKKRVGINTDEPAGALTIWDEDAELTFIKDSQRTMYLGSTRTTNVAIGTNNRKQITLLQDSVNIGDPITIQGVRFSVEEKIPERAGLPLEIVMVRSARADQPRFYICNGGSQWQALGS